MQYVDFVANNSIWVGEPAGQGLDAGWTAYDTTSLQKTGSFGGVASDQFVGTSGGRARSSWPPSDAQSACTQAPSSPSQPGERCVHRVTDLGKPGRRAIPYAAANETDLLGPSPAGPRDESFEVPAKVFLSSRLSEPVDTLSNARRTLLASACTIEGR